MSNRFLTLLMVSPLCVGSNATADTISIDGPATGPSPSLGGTIATPSELVSPLALFPGSPAVETNAFTYGRRADFYVDIRFSVDRFSTGAAGSAVLAQAEMT